MRSSEKEERFKQLIRASGNGIYRVCLSFLDSEENIKDLQQEIHVQIWKSMDRFKGESSWNTYIYRIAVNTAIRFKTELNRHLGWIDQQVDISRTEPILTAEDENILLLRSLIKQLADQDRIIISLVLEGLTYKEIGQVLNLSTAHAGVRISRVKSKLKTLMEKENGKV